MTQYPRGPYILRIDYTQNQLTHTLDLNVDVIGDAVTGTAPADITLRSRAGGGVLLNGAADEIWGVIRPNLPTSTTASSYALFKPNVNNNDLLFISGGILTQPNGSSTNTVVPASQATLTWRSGNGNIAKMVLLEHVYASNSRTSLGASGTAAIEAINTYVLSDNNVLMARDRSFPVVPLNVSFGQNEKTFNRRYRS